MLGNSRSAKRAAIGSRHIVASDKTIVIGVGLLVAALALGGGLADNRAGTGIDRWFQRITAAGAVRPGQPGFHYRLFVTLTHSVELGRFPEVAYVVTAVVAILFAVAAQRGCRLRIAGSSSRRSGPSWPWWSAPDRANSSSWWSTAGWLGTWA